MNAAMLKLFGDFNGFTAKADVRLQEKNIRQPTTLTMNFAMLDRNVRVDLDMAQVKSTQMTPETLASLKQAGLSRMTTIIRPDRKVAMLVYPAIQSYAEMPMAKEEAADMDRIYKIQKSRLGKETVDGQSTEKNKVVLTADNGDKQEATVWYATDLKNFPIKIQLNQPEVTVVMQYRDVKLTRPDGKQFEAPAGFTRYASIEVLMQNAMIKGATGGK
jgi:hypothetical protein